MAGRPSPFWAHPGRTRYRCAAAAPCHPRGPGLPGAGTCRPARRYTWHVPPVDLGWTLADPPRTGRTGPPDRQTNTHAARIVTLGEQLAVTRWYARTETHSSRYRPTTTSGLACGSGLIENFRPDSPTTPTRRCTTHGRNSGPLWRPGDLASMGTSGRGAVIENVSDDARRLAGPAEPELGCEECCEALDTYVEPGLAREDADAQVPRMRAHLQAARPAAVITTACSLCC